MQRREIFFGVWFIYKDIQKRTNGEIYIGVVGWGTESQRSLSGLWICLYFRTSKMRKKKKRTLDELPQSAAGKTIMTTEPKFIPQEAAEITLADESSVSVRLIDCVGFMVEGANGHLEGTDTAWYIRRGSRRKFLFGCENGTEKSNQRHATIGIVVTTDGSIGDLPRENYVEAEQTAVGKTKDWKTVCDCF